MSAYYVSGKVLGTITTVIIKKILALLEFTFSWGKSDDKLLLKVLRSEKTLGYLWTPKK